MVPSRQSWLYLSLWSMFCVYAVVIDIWRQLSHQVPSPALVKTLLRASNREPHLLDEHVIAFINSFPTHISYFFNSSVKPSFFFKHPQNQAHTCPHHTYKSLWSQSSRSGKTKLGIIFLWTTQRNFVFVFLLECVCDRDPPFQRDRWVFRVVCSLYY